MILPMKRFQQHEEVKRLLTDPLTWGQSTKAIVRFTGCSGSTVRRIRNRLVAAGLSPLNPHSEASPKLGGRPKRKREAL